MTARPAIRGAMAGEAFRFLVAGGLNTVATLLVYWLLLPHAGYAIAYTIAFVLGIAISYLLNLRFVFRASASVPNAIAFPFVYAIQYVLGLGVLAAWTSVLHLPARYGVLASIAATVPVTFVLSRFVLRRL